MVWLVGLPFKTKLSSGRCARSNLSLLTVQVHEGDVEGGNYCCSDDKAGGQLRHWNRGAVPGLVRAALNERLF